MLSTIGGHAVCRKDAIAALVIMKSLSAISLRLQYSVLIVGEPIQPRIVT